MNVEKVSAPLHSPIKTDIPSNAVIFDGSLLYFPVVFFVRKAIP